MENFANGVTLLGVPALLLVPLVVEGLKRLGLATRWATPAAILTGGVVAALAQAVQSWPALDPAVRVIVAAVVFGFGASGVYSQAARVRTSGEEGPALVQE